MKGYDLDGVLAQAPVPSTKKWGLMKGVERQERTKYLMEHYASALKLREPEENELFILTARKATPLVKKITIDWLMQNFPTYPITIDFLEQARNIRNVVAFKSAKIKEWGITEYIEDNITVLKGIKKECPNVKCIYFDGKTETII